MGLSHLRERSSHLERGFYRNKIFSPLLLNAAISCAKLLVGAGMSTVPVAFANNESLRPNITSHAGPPSNSKNKKFNFNLNDVKCFTAMTESKISSSEVEANDTTLVLLASSSF